MHHCCSLNIINFADDSTAYLIHDDINSAIPLINRELEGVDEWVCANKLSLNTSKTAYTIFSNMSQSNTPNLLIRNTEIMPCQIQKFLGVTLDNNLNFKDHINFISNKVKSANGILWKLSQFCPNEVLTKIYYTLVYPYLIYGVEIWGNSSKTALDRLSRLVQTAQKRTKPNVSNSTPNLHQHLSVPQIHKFFSLIRCYKYYKLKSNNYFCLKFSSLHPTHDINTRSNANNQFNTPNINIERVKWSFFYSAYDYWNHLPIPIRNSENISSFKRRVRQHIGNSIIQ